MAVPYPPCLASVPHRALSGLILAWRECLRSRRWTMGFKPIVEANILFVRHSRLAHFEPDPQPEYHRHVSIRRSRCPALLTG